MSKKKEKSKKVVRQFAFRSLFTDISEKIEAERVDFDPTTKDHLSSTKASLFSHPKKKVTEPEAPKGNTEVIVKNTEVTAHAGGGLTQNWSLQEVDASRILRVFIPILTLGLLIYIAVFGVATDSAEETGSQIVNKNQVSLFVPDAKKVAPVSSLNRAAIKEARSKTKTSSNLEPDTIYSIEFDRAEAYAPLTAQTFVNALYTQVPASFVRTLEESFSYGTHQTTTNNTVSYLALTIFSFEQAYSDMLTWEQHMSKDLQGIINEIPVDEPNVFQDAVVNGHDIRVLTDTKEEDILVYGFVGDKLLVIAEDRQTLATVITRTTEQNP